MNKTQRIDVADALRGFSVMGILLLHCIEHFNFYSFPEVSNEFLKFTDKSIWDSLFFIFGGKAYGIFAILLFIWGNINAIFFTAEVLVLFSITGIALIFVARLKTRTVLIIAAILMLQPMEWGKLVYALLNPEYTGGANLAGAYFKAVYPVQENGTFFEMVKTNLWEGQLASLVWAWENARFFQMPALFMLGMLIGRTKLFIRTDENLRFWRIALIIGIICFFPLNGLHNMLPDFIENKAILKPLRLIIKSLANVAFITFLVSLIIQVYYLTTKGNKLLSKMQPYGKMSLTNYIMQSIVGAALFYNWGFGLHNKLGITFSFLVGIALFILQYQFCRWWMKNHRQGPLEYIWKQLTWIDTWRDKNVYFISGMCNNCKVFDGIKLPKGYRKKYIEWNIPNGNESLEEYTKKMAESINTRKPFYLVGYSFGAIIMQEMNSFLSPEKNIIISSMKSEKEIPAPFRLARTVSFAESLPTRIYASTGFITNIFTRFVYSMPASKLKEYMTFLDPAYVKWSIHHITNWIPKHEVKNLYHIHGTKDQIFPFEQIENAYTVIDGDHMMVITKAEEVSTIIKDILKQ